VIDTKPEIIQKNIQTTNPMNIIGSRRASKVLNGNFPNFDPRKELSSKNLANFELQSNGQYARRGNQFSIDREKQHRSLDARIDYKDDSQS